MVTDFLPKMRGLVSHELHERGESQRRIADLLGITQARVSYYLGKKKIYFSNELATKFGQSTNDILGYGKILAEDSLRSQSDGIFTLYSIWKHLLFTGAICLVHQKVSGVPSDCSMCMQLHRLTRESVESQDQETEDVTIIREISDAVSLIEESVYFPAIMPAVSVNIAMCRRSPQTSSDVAAIPGRINRIHGRAKAFVLPEFGSSNHNSRVLLLANSRNPKVRAILNIKYDNLIDRSLNQLDVPKRFTDNSTKKSRRRLLQTNQADTFDPVLARLSKADYASESEESVLAIVDRGSEGVEPITYLIGRNATQLAQESLKIARIYSQFASS